MLCQDCKKKESTVHLTQIVNNQKITLNLCQDCAEKRGFHNPFVGGAFPLGEMLASVTSGIIEKKISGASTAKCPSCGMVFSDFPKVGRFGCGQCYTAFRPMINQMLSRIHGATEHKGDLAPLIPKVQVRELTKEEQLDEDLKKAIAKEDFERAAHIRDQIKAHTSSKKK